jgi:hypothetical protein
MEEQFPREIRDLIYQHAVSSEESCWDYGIVSNAARIVRIPSLGVEEEDSTDYVHLHDPRFGTPNTRLELALAWWHTAALKIHRFELLNHLEKLCPWRCGVSPAILIRHLIVDVDD